MPGDDAELTTDGTAGILGASRPLVVRRMEAGDLPFRWVDSHRRCAPRDVLAYKIRLDEQQRVMEAMAIDMDDLREKYGL